jgi:hypothetical protein
MNNVNFQPLIDEIQREAPPNPEYNTPWYAGGVVTDSAKAIGWIGSEIGWIGSKLFAGFSIIFLLIAPSTSLTNMLTIVSFINCIVLFFMILSMLSLS